MKNRQQRPVLYDTKCAGFNASHALIIRFSDQMIISYSIVNDALKRYCRDALRFIERRWHQETESYTCAGSNEAIELRGTTLDVHNEDLPFPTSANT